MRGYDPVAPAPPGVQAVGSDADACRGAGLVLSLTTAAAADEALRQSLPGLIAEDGHGPAVYADANTATAGAKVRLAEVAAAAEVPFADIAIMAPVPGAGDLVPMLVSGTGALRTSAMLAECGATAEVLQGPAGTAATRKLLRSVFYKGMAAAVIEALLAARSAGCEDWLREHISAELAGLRCQHACPDGDRQLQTRPAPIPRNGRSRRSARRTRRASKNHRSQPALAGTVHPTAAPAE